MASSVYCLAETVTQADLIVDYLRSKGVSRDDISILSPDTRSTRHFGHERHTKAPEGAVSGAAAGGLLGGALGWLVGIGTLAIPGVGPFIAAGPLLAALSGATIGATVAGITGALIGMGIPEYEARRYEGKVREGRILISVHAVDGKEVAGIKRVFSAAGATDIASASEAAVPAGHHH